MTLDEKIAECEADIEKCERVCAVTAIGSIRDAAMRKAEDCKQMVKWLEDYKKLKMTESGGENADIELQSNKCEYCHEDSDGYVKPLEKNCHTYIRFGMHGWVIELKAKGWRGKAPINFCPMCGRRLTNG